MNKTRKDKLRIAKTLRGMKYRCNNPNYHDYHRYGGRGIKVCKEWTESTDSFIEWSLKNGYDSKKSIDRIDVDKGYSPENCRWTDMSTQQNNRGNNIILFYKEEYRTIREWSDILGIEYEVIRDRYYKGWEVKDILEKPKNSHRKLLTLYGETKSLVDWSKELNIGISTLRYRMNNGFSDDEIINGKRSNSKKKESNEEILYGKNSSKSTIYLEHDGKKLTLKEWGRIVGVHQDTLRNRMKKGYEIEKILYGEKGEI